MALISSHTSVLWWIICKRTDTDEYSTQERVLNIESTGRKVERMVWSKKTNP
jgi:hypothetical protein